MGVQDIPEFLTRLDKRQKHNGLTVLAIAGHLGGNLVKVRVQRTAQLAHGVVTAAHAHGGDIQLQRDGLGHDAAEEPFPDGVGQFVLVGQAVKYLAQVAQVAAVRRGRHAQHVGGRDPVQNAAVAVGHGMVRLVNDDGAEVVMGELFQPLGPLQALHAAHGHAVPAAQAAVLGFFQCTGKPGRALYLVGSLGQQLAAVG